MNVGAVIVTYANRSSYFEKVIRRLASFNEISTIVIVNNGIEDESRQVLNTLIDTYNQIKLVDLNYNSGSATGFKEGIKAALDEGVDYLWLLDDDNLPQKDSLQVLINQLGKLETHNELVSLLSFRPERHIYKKAIQSKQPYLMLGKKNAFLGFDLFSKFSRKEPVNVDSSIQIGKVAVAPYGGMFFHRRVIDTIGLPDERFFLYADDHDFSYRITKAGGSILLALQSELEDLETSFHMKKPKRILHTRFFSTNSKNAIYYSVRNNIHFEKNFVTNKVKYGINKIAYIFMLFLMMILNPKQFWKFPVIIKAIKASGKFMSYD